MNVLSIQSHVAFGHAGNAAAVFPLQRLGVEVWPVHTVQLSNHTGYPDWRGRAFTAEEIAAVIAGIEARGAFESCDAVLSGYIGDAAVVAVVADVVARVKAANPGARYCCDPVMGDDAKGLYVAAPVAAAIERALVPKADILLPNRFELARLAGGAIEGVDRALAALNALAAKGPEIAVCTSLASDGEIAVVGRSREGAWLVETPRITGAANGAGDAFAAILLARLLAGLALDAALSLAVSSLHAVLRATRKAGERELRLVAAQAEIAAPSRLFPAERLR